MIGIPGVLKINDFFDVKVVDYGFRSITAIPFPLNINKAPRETIEALPGIGKKRVIRILANRPFKDKNQLIDAFDDSTIADKILDYISIEP